MFMTVLLRQLRKERSGDARKFPGIHQDFAVIALERAQVYILRAPANTKLLGLCKKALEKNM